MTTQALKPNIHAGTFAGVKDTYYSIDVSPQYLDNVITIIPQSNSGLVTIEAIEYLNTAYEYVENGTIDLSAVSRTTKIKGYPLESIRVKINETVPFTIYIKQYRGESY